MGASEPEGLRGGSLHMPIGTAAVRQIRQQLQAALVSLGVPVQACDDAAMVASELLGNALNHAHPLPSGELELSWRLEDDYVRVAVTDGGGEPIPERPLRPPSEQEHGRGLGIVDRLADDWGVQELDCGRRTVWALLPLVATTSLPLAQLRLLAAGIDESPNPRDHAEPHDFREL